MSRSFKRFSLASENGIAIISMMRPEKKNALDIEMIKELSTLCRYFNATTELNIVVLTGENGIFSAGGDIVDWSGLTPDQFSNTWLREGNAAFDALAQLRQPVLAVLNGLTLGGGLELAACADYRIGETNCKIGQPETSLGVVAGWSGTQRLSRRFGAQTVRRMALFGEVFSGREALQMGLIDQLVSNGEGLTTAISLANKVIKRSSLATQVTKCMVNAAEGEGTNNAIDMLAGRLVASGHDLKEGIKAFNEKRSPNFLSTKDATD